MGLFGNIGKRILNRTTDNLTYRATDTVTNTITGGVEKGIGKIKGDKGVVKALEKCPKCKAKLGPDAKFCPDCGYRLIVVCEKCNVEYQVGTKFCKQCGGQLK